MRSLAGLGDRGQAFPFYIAAIAGLLFAALAFFVVGQAGATRSDAQGAADAAALAAAGDARDHLAGDVDLATLPSADWEKLLGGVGLDGLNGCDAAHRFAALNGAEASCTRSGLTFAVGVKTTRTVGKSVIPGTEAMHGSANAVAVIKPLCHLGGSAKPGVDLDDDAPGPLSQVKIVCGRGTEVIFDPAKPVPWTGIARKLFDVRLTD
ncbi:pilus assembly protein TadG-related protein [Streptomyces sp. NBC_00291]|uniref:pilus assembly protein TadG-related protein n=1 Tax=Streptomyces sp. NBC_00291 TaxID=2975704 RepID=UPI0022534C77|nr:pilus assembly protein TadG-related protein [Streptomyces sp. NBC_00291]MCX5154806.1 pilus assembly protein TadG-related protein [Streptomyces sp. NBC_00291]